MTKLKIVPLSQGQVIDLTINSMAYDNSAVAHYKDFVIFVDRGAPGDLVKAEVTTIRPNYARAKILELKESNASYRIEAPCKLFKVCGGCQWQHLPYEKQLEQKDLLMKNFITKLNLEEGVLKSIIGACALEGDCHTSLCSARNDSATKGIPRYTEDSTQHSNIWHYRNKVQFPVRTVESTGRLKAGYFEWHSNDLVNIKHCPIQNSLFDGIVETVRELAPKYKITAYNSKNKTGWLRHICIRVGVSTGEAILTLVCVNESLSRSQEFANEILMSHPELVGICFNINTKSTNVIYGEKTKVIKGKGYIFEKIKDLKFKISATSFFQINTSQAEKLLDIVNGSLALTGNEIILDAYCGVGLFSLSFAKKAKKVIGIEEIKQAIEDGKSSAKENGIKNHIFVNGKVENKIKEVLKNEKPNVVILDPPRAGCSKTVLENILDSNVKKIIYVSCNPNTLIRDLEILKSKFKINLIQPIDMFPHTYHIESIAIGVRPQLL